jgi:predicted nuclease of predicted toxin-antitoxin system
MCLLLDENISPTLVPKFWEQQIDTVHLRDRNLLSCTDHELWEFAAAEKRAIVTINGRDFIALARRASFHYWVMIIPSGGTPPEMYDYIMAAVEWARADRIGPIDFSQKVISVAIDLGILAEPVFDPTLLMGEVPGITRLYSA